MRNVSKSDMIDIIEKVANLNPEVNNSEEFDEKLRQLIHDSQKIMMDLGLAKEPE